MMLQKFIGFIWDMLGGVTSHKSNYQNGSKKRYGWK
jgi:hypothetical protein